MSIFEARMTVAFGPALPMPTQDRPAEAVFMRGNVPDGVPFGLTWVRDGRAAGYRILRSQSVSHVRAGSMASLWSGTYGDAVTHFSVGPDVDAVVDRYKLRGAGFMFYWVLSQDKDGTLREAQGLKVHIADHVFQGRRHLALEEAPRYEEVAVPSAGGPSPGSAPATAENLRPPPRPLAQPAPAVVRALRQVMYIPYTPPLTLQILPSAAPVVSYELYVGGAMATQDQGDAMWDGAFMAGNPLRRYNLPGNIEGFTDRFNPAGRQAYMALFALHPDGSRSQPDVGVPSEPPSMCVDLT
jgi:hypothetical protein